MIHEIQVEDVLGYRDFFAFLKKLVEINPRRICIGLARVVLY